MASRSNPTTYPASPCFNEFSFGFNHGTSATVANIIFPGKFPVKVGTPVYLTADQSAWYGFTVDWRYEDSSDTTKIQAVDWRDRLSDLHIFCAFNMQDDGGRYYHIVPSDWKNQKRIYVTRELDQQDFLRVQGGGFVSMSVNWGKELVSSWVILDMLGVLFRFRITADPNVQKILRTTYPNNIDWNNGARVIDAVQAILDKSQMQLSTIGTNVMRITLRGFSTDTFAHKFLEGSITACDLLADTSSIGQQFHDKGRRVLVQGDRNRYEYTFPCVANWNPRWDFMMCYGGVPLAALYESLGIAPGTPIKIKDLPKEYHDHETWTESHSPALRGADPAKRTRMEMLVTEYIEKIVYKAYVVDFSSVTIDFESTGKEEEFTGEILDLDKNTLKINPAGPRPKAKDYPRGPDGYNFFSHNSLWPIASRLVSETNLQSLVFSTSNKIIRGVESPFYEQQTFVPKLSGASLDIEEVMNNGITEYRVRVFFNDIQTFTSPEAFASQDPTHPDYKAPDLVLVRLALERDIYAYVQGETGNGFRSREHKVNVANLSKAYVNGVEVAFLAENFVQNLAAGGAVPAQRPVKADDIAKSIATQLLVTTAIQSTGNLEFKGRAGSLPDGLIDAVQVNVGNDGISEYVSLGLGPTERKEIIPLSVVRMSHKILDETELNRKRLAWAAKTAWEDGKRMAAEKKRLGKADDSGDGTDVASTHAHYSKEGLVQVRYDASQPIDFVPGHVVMTETMHEEVG